MRLRLILQLFLSTAGNKIKFYNLISRIPAQLHNWWAKMLTGPRPDAKFSVYIGACVSTLCSAASAPNGRLLSRFDSGCNAEGRTKSCTLTHYIHGKRTRPQSHSSYWKSSSARRRRRQQQIFLHPLSCAPALSLWSLPRKKVNYDITTAEQRPRCRWNTSWPNRREDILTLLVATPTLTHHRGVANHGRPR